MKTHFLILKKDKIQIPDAIEYVGYRNQIANLQKKVQNDEYKHIETYLKEKLGTSVKINNDMITYMKNKDSFSLGVVRMVKGAIQLEKINLKRELNDDEVIAVIGKQIKMRNDSISEFEKANRSDLVEQYKKEIELLSKYMPEQLSLEEINKIIDEAFASINPTSTKDMGLIMREVSPKLKGRADMAKVNAIIKEKLANL